MRSPGDRLFLIGGRGAGKTTVGRLLAKQINWSFVDADDLMQKREGRTIAAIFAEEGEPYFRKRESALLTELSTESEVVIATGGGAVLAAANRSLLKESGLTVWLRVTPIVAQKRIAADPLSATTRPALTGQQELLELEATFRLRESLYRDSSRFAVDTDGQSPPEVVSTILAAWRSWPTCR